VVRRRVARRHRRIVVGIAITGDVNVDALHGEKQSRARGAGIGVDRACLRRCDGERLATGRDAHFESAAAAVAAEQHAGEERRPCDRSRVANACSHDVASLGQECRSTEDSFRHAISERKRFRNAYSQTRDIRNGHSSDHCPKTHRKNGRLRASGGCVLAGR
jgi:hypothetical protein